MAVVRSSVTSRKGSVPAAVFCRRTLAEHLDADEILRLTQQGFDFYDWGPGEIRLVTSWDQGGQPVRILADAIASL